MFLTEHFALRLQVCCWFLESLKVEWEADPLAIRLLSCGTNSQFWSVRQTPSLLLRLILKLSFVAKLLVRVAHVTLSYLYSYAAIGLGCWRTSGSISLTLLSSPTALQSALFVVISAFNFLFSVIFLFIEGTPGLAFC